jgi:VWFA-related protein
MSQASPQIRNMARSLIALLLLIPQDTLQVKVSLVTVGVRVTDSRERNVLNLKATDFSIFDDGVAQKIEFFSSEEQAITLGIVLDRSASMSYNNKLERAKEAARALVRATHDGSEYFVFKFDDQVTLASDFTMDRNRVQSAIDQTRLGRGTSLYDAVMQSLALCGKAQLPRQALIVISDGADQHSLHELQETMQFVRESETQIYTIGYFGPDEDRLFRRSGAKVQLSDGSMIDNPREVLERLAQESGAESFFPRTDAELARAVEEIANDLRNQYTLAFYPQAEKQERSYHQLRVTVRGRYNVRARPGYSTLELVPAVARRADYRGFESKVERRNGRVSKGSGQRHEAGCRRADLHSQPAQRVVRILKKNRTTGCAVNR